MSKGDNKKGFDYSGSEFESHLMKDLLEIYNTIPVKKQEENNSNLDRIFEDKWTLIQIIRNGVPYSFFQFIQKYLPLSEQDWAGLLDISTKSLQRYRSTENFQFKPIHSEKIIAMAEVTQLGLRVFGDNDKFKLWLDTPNFALGQMKPIELLKDSYGKELVIGELTRIQYGIFV